MGSVTVVVAECDRAAWQLTSLLARSSRAMGSTSLTEPPRHAATANTVDLHFQREAQERPDQHDQPQEGDVLEIGRHGDERRPGRRLPGLASDGWVGARHDRAYVKATTQD